MKKPHRFSPSRADAFMARFADCAPTPAARRRNALHLAMMEAKQASGLNQLQIARRLGMAQPNVSRHEHSQNVSSRAFSAYLLACGFDFSISLRPLPSTARTPAKS